METNYMQVVELTDEEQIKLYLKSCTKKKLAEMLTEANKHLKNLSRVELPVSAQEGDFKLLTLFMANSTARISDKNKWIVRDDNLWFVYGQEYGKKVRKLLETDKFVKALALLSD